MSSLQVVHLRINDAATGKPTPVRLRVTDRAGRYFPPLGRLPSADAIRRSQPWHGGNLLLDGKAYAYIDGTCEILLPAGELLFEIHKGPNYAPVLETYTRPAGKLACRFEIRRRPEAPEGLKCGDFLVRNLSPHAAALMGAAEGLDFVHLVAELTDSGEVPLFDDFSGEAPIAQCDGCQVQVGTLNRGDGSGDLVLLNTHRMVFPLRLGQQGFENYKLADLIGQAQRKRGLALYWAESPEALTAFSIPKGLDALLVTFGGEENLPTEIPVVAGSGRSNSCVALGSHRSWWPAELSPSEAIRQGKVCHPPC